MSLPFYHSGPPHTDDSSPLRPSRPSNPTHDCMPRSHRLPKPVRLKSLRSLVAELFPPPPPTATEGTTAAAELGGLAEKAGGRRFSTLS